MKRLLVMGLVLGLAFAGLAWGAAGDRDGGFGERGFAILDEPSSADEFLGDVTMLPGGKILAVGTRGAATGYMVARLNRDGSPDTGFDLDGIFVQPSNGGALQPRSLARLDVDSRGRIVAAGLASGPGMGFNAYGFARYLPGGLPDGTFDGDGIQIVAPLPYGDAFAVATGPRDEIVAAGGLGADKAAVVRLTSGGQPDTTLAPDGIEIVDVPVSTFERATAVEVLANSSILVGGSSEAGGFLAKLDPFGTPDPRFGSGGFTVRDLGTDNDPSGELVDIAAGGGGIVAVGAANAGGDDAELVAVRYLANGSLDPSFGTNGVFRLNPTPDGDFANAVAVQPDGRIVIAGAQGVESAAGADVWLLRLSSRGRLDRSFGEGGQVLASAVDGEDEAAGLALQRDGGIVVAGSAQGPSGSRLMLARSRGDPPCLGQAATITGTNGRDRLKGTRGRDVINGLGGADRATGAGGADLLCGGAGRDVLRGGKGGDRTDGGPGRDLCAGGPGKDGRRRCEAGSA